MEYAKTGKEDFLTDFAASIADAPMFLSFRGLYLMNATVAVMAFLPNLFFEGRESPAKWPYPNHVLVYARCDDIRRSSMPFGGIGYVETAFFEIKYVYVGDPKLQGKRFEVLVSRSYNGGYNSTFKPPLKIGEKGIWLVYKRGTQLNVHEFYDPPRDFPARKGITKDYQRRLRLAKTMEERYGSSDNGDD